jgi:hypothetical protein
VGGGAEQQLSDSIYRFDYAVVEGGIYIIRDGALDYLESSDRQEHNPGEDPKAGHRHFGFAGRPLSALRASRRAR